MRQLPTDTAPVDEVTLDREPPVKASDPKGGELFIVDNSDSEWKGLKYLQDWTDIASAFDIASGFFEIGSLLALDGRWQALEKIRILLGAEISARTRQALLEGLRQRTEQVLDQSIEDQKEQNDFLNGVPAIVDAIRAGKIECRVYAKKKFHAKTYITHPKVICSLESNLRTCPTTTPIYTIGSTSPSSARWNARASKSSPA